MWLEGEEGENGDRLNPKFLRDGIDYTFPDYIFILHKTRNFLYFNLLVEDALPNSSKLYLDDDEKSVSVKFCVIKLDPNECRHYAFMVKMPVQTIQNADCFIQEKNVVIRIKIPVGEDLKWFLCGLTDSKLQKKTVENYQLKMDEQSPDVSPDASGDEAEGVDGWITTDL